MAEQVFRKWVNSGSQNVCIGKRIIGMWWIFINKLTICIGKRVNRLIASLSRPQQKMLAFVFRSGLMGCCSTVLGSELIGV